MSSFESYITDKDYVQSYGFNNKWFCFVEDESDIIFWEDYFRYFNNDTYEIKPVVSNLNPYKRGKQALEKIIPNLSKYVILAIDSDYDYLCPNSRETYSREVNNNPFILHTFFYSRESYNYRIEKLNLIFNKIKYTIKHELNLTEFVLAYSSLCYKILIPFLFILENNLNILYKGRIVSQNLIKEILRIKSKKKLTDNDFKINEEIFNNLNSSIEEFNNYIFPIINSEKYHEYVHNFLASKINTNNAYQFISGHLLESLLNNLCEHLIILLMKKETKEIIRQCSHLGENKTEHIKNQINKMKSYFRNRCCYLSLIEDTTYENFNHDCYLMLNKKYEEMRALA